MQEEFSLQLDMFKELNLVLVAAMSHFANQKGNQSDDQINIEIWAVHADFQRSGVYILTKPMLGDTIPVNYFPVWFLIFLSQFDLEF